MFQLLSSDALSLCLFRLVCGQVHGCGISGCSWGGGIGIGCRGGINDRGGRRLWLLLLLLLLVLLLVVGQLRLCVCSDSGIRRHGQD